MAAQPPQDFPVPDSPTDGITSMAFSPVANYLIASSWDNNVRCYEVAPTGTVPKAMFGHDQPILSACWKKDGQAVFTASCDKTVKMFQLANPTPMLIGTHDAPVKHVAWIEEMQCVVTASWDRTLKYWDPRTPQTPKLTVQLPERVYSMDVGYPLNIVATAERHICIFDMMKPEAIYKTFPSPLKHQTRCVAAFPDRTGFALGSIEGRVAIHYVQDKDISRNFAFKCHREQSAIYAVNNISFHPGGTFATCGSDGAFNFWDKDSKQRLKPFGNCGQPITASCFNHDGTIFAYALSYDWSKGVEYYNPATMKNQIMLHQTTEAEIKPRPSGANRGKKKY
eukprot:GFYU01013940.1.p1 GENE.GFYU01013940.1~~GFYU01013940.1.p1  ORF type:complete len:338 (+),score=56.38 GFYU01013940.1:169-1182(+)